MVCHILDALLGDEPSLTGTVFYVCISDFMLDFYIYAFWRGCILGASVSLEQLLGDGVQMYIDSYESSC